MKKMLKTSDIKAMGLKEFMAFKNNGYEIFSCAELCKANSKWLIISDLEGVEDMKELKKLINQMKEDLWWSIHNGKKG